MERIEAQAALLEVADILVVGTHENDVTGLIAELMAEAGDRLPDPKCNETCSKHRPVYGEGFETGFALGKFVGIEEGKASI